VTFAYRANDLPAAIRPPTDGARLPVWVSAAITPPPACPLPLLLATSGPAAISWVALLWHQRAGTPSAEEPPCRQGNGVADSQVRDARRGGRHARRTRPAAAGGVAPALALCCSQPLRQEEARAKCSSSLDRMRARNYRNLRARQVGGPASVDHRTPPPSGSAQRCRLRGASAWRLEPPAWVVAGELYCRAIATRISASLSLISSPLRSMVTVWSLPVKRKGAL
jgi:hypothetical protein